MALNVIKLVQGATEIDLNDGSNSALVDFQPQPPDLQTTLARAPFGHGAELAFARRDLAQHTVRWQQKASSHDNLVTKITDIERLLEAAMENQEYRNRNWSYTPVYFQYKPADATVLAQTEVLYGGWQPPTDAFGVPLRSKYFRGSQLSLACRPFLDATALSTLVAATTINNGLGNAISFAGRLGSVAAPSRITLDTFSGGSDDRVVVGLRRLGTPANFVAGHELESATLGGNLYWAVNLITSVDESGFSPGSGNVGIEILPTGAEGYTTYTNFVVATITLSSNIADQLGAFKVFVRCKGLNNRVIGLLVRPFVQYGALAKQYGPYTTVYPVYPAALNEIEMLDLTPTSPIRVASLHSAGIAPAKVGYEIVAQAGSTASTPKLRCDYMQLIPVGEGNGGTGALDTTLPVAFTATGMVSVRLDTRDLNPPVGLFDGTPTLAYGYSKKAGRGIFLPPNGKLFFMLTTGANAVHDYTRTFKAKLEYAARYLSLMGTT